MLIREVGGGRPCWDPSEVVFVEIDVVGFVLLVLGVDVFGSNCSEYLTADFFVRSISTVEVSIRLRRDVAGESMKPGPFLRNSVQCVGSGVGACSTIPSPTFDSP